MSQKTSIFLSTISLLVAFMFGNQEVKAQINSYSAQKATILIQGSFMDSSFEIKSSELSVRFNYETAEFNMQLKFSSLTSSNDTISSLLAKMKDGTIRYNGEMEMEEIPVEAHKPYSFGVVGILEADSFSRMIVGEGYIQHVAANFHSCVLDMSFQLKLSDFDIKLNNIGLDDNINVVISQTILKKAYAKY
jgi:hypothetical protein